MLVASLSACRHLSKWRVASSLSTVAVRSRHGTNSVQYRQGLRPNSGVEQPLHYRLLSTQSPNNNTEEKPKKKGVIAMFKEYGVPFLIYETVVWLGSGIVLYVGVSAAGGYEQVLPMLKNAGIDQYVNLDTLDPRYGNLAITIALNEALEIVRFPLVVATTPKVVQMWRSRRSKA